MSTLKANRYENTASSSGGIDIDSSGNVGIATATTNGVLSVKTSASRQLDVETDSGDGNLVLKCTAPNSSNNLRNIDIAGQNVSFSTGAFDTTAHTERVRIDSTGAVKLLSGAGIDFSGIQTNATGMTSETLDSYEEGTWTPGWVASGTVATDVANGNYTKIGDLIFLSFVIGSTGTPTGTDTIGITGAPFSADATTNITRYQGSLELIHFTVNSTSQYSLGFSGATTLSIRRMTSTAGNVASTWSEVSNAGSFEARGSIVYKRA